MKRILYVGNKLNNKHTNVSNISILGGLLEEEQFKVYYASSKENKILRILNMLASCYIYRNKVDFVLIDTYSTQNFYYAFLVSLYCKFLAIKFIPILHGGNLPSRLHKNPKMSGAIFNNAYINISPSLFLKSEFEKFGYDNLTFIPNTVVINNYKFEEKDFKEIKLLWVRSFSKIYNPKMAITVLKLLQDKGYKTSLCMVGPDSDGSLGEVKQFANHLNVVVKFTGKLSKTEWINLAHDYNIFINTTHFDNMPVSVIEAMALGLPIVSTNVGGMPYLISNRENGLLVDKDSTEQMVKSIEEIVNNPDLGKTMANAARAKAEKFDWSVVKTQWEIILR